eukprot:1331230-Amphidinium_carterae.1
MPQVFDSFARLAVQHQRVLVMKGWKGPTTLPKRGLPQGDGLSVVLAVLWGWALQSFVAESGFDLSVLVYLDDVSISAPACSEVAKGFALASSFLWGWGVQLNASKSSVAYIGQGAHVPDAMHALERVSSFKLLGINTGPDPSDVLLAARVQEANERLDRIDLLSLPLNQVRKLVSVFVVPVLYGAAFAPCAIPEWGELVTRIMTSCFGTTRFLGSKPMIRMTAHRAHSWHPEHFRTCEGMSVLQSLGRSTDTRAKVDHLVGLGHPAVIHGIPFWANLICWIQSCGGSLLPGGVIQVNQKPRLDFNMPCEEWKHEVRELLRLRAYLDASRMARGLRRDDAFRMDSFLLHHVLISGRHDTSQETVASGAVVTKDRMHRHKQLCDGLCEFSECGLLDTVPHRLFDCCGTSSSRTHAGWSLEDTERVKEQGHACANYGIWHLPWEREVVHFGLLAILSQEAVSEYLQCFQYATKASTLGIRFCMRSFPCKHPRGAFAWVHVRVQDGAQVALEKLHICEGLRHSKDLTFALFTLAWVPATAFGSRVGLAGDFDFSDLSARVLSPAEGWASLRSLCCRASLSLVTCTREEILPSPLANCESWEASVVGLARACVLTQNLGTCKRLRALMHSCVTSYPRATALSHGQKTLRRGLRLPAHRCSASFRYQLQLAWHCS